MTYTCDICGFEAGDWGSAKYYDPTPCVICGKRTCFLCGLRVSGFHRQDPAPDVRYCKGCWHRGKRHRAKIARAKAKARAAWQAEMNALLAWIHEARSAVVDEEAAP